MWFSFKDLSKYKCAIDILIWAFCSSQAVKCPGLAPWDYNKFTTAWF